MSEPIDLAEVRLEKMRGIEALGLDPWGQRFDGRTPIGEIRQLPAAKFEDDGPVGPKVRAAGRLVRHRTGGKLQFLELWDQTGRVQLMVRVNKVSADDWKLLQYLDLGDILGVDGEFGHTKTGELTIQAEKLTFLSKALEPHPKDVSGLSDTEYRLRHRYLDMIYTPDTLRRAHQRVKIIRTIRNHLDDHGLSRSRDANATRDSPAGPRPGRSERTTTPWTSRYSCGLRWNFRSSGCSSAGSRRCTRLAGCSATRASARGTTPSSPCSNSTKPTATCSASWT